ncbi:chorismate mutase/prephenate dehydratase [Heliomicrobium modesticaldum Ice1]|uniref:Prephenate dehydratase n=2 Tax=Heliomicrobium modesticaldum TaxID=35701 RepID=B0TFQ2_HELMI|nr:chorismate mutase/prephenate dehydratase [Heliomicrobium modesticaldum Ice1]
MRDMMTERQPKGLAGAVKGPVGYLGPEGTFSEEAARAFFLPDTTLRPFSSISAVYEALSLWEIEAAILPLENSIEGTINQTLDELVENPGLFIFGELILPVHNHLLVPPGVDWTRVVEVYSHPQPLAQCRRFLEAKLPNARLIATASTVEGAKKALELTVPEAPRAAVGSAFAARRLGLQIAQSDIQSRPNNKTRFVVVGRQLTEPTGNDKTSLVCSLPQDRPGGLYAILKEFAEREINLTRIESRPTKHELGQYLFFIDFVGHQRDRTVAEALNAIGQFTTLTRVLGSYLRG